MKNLIRTLRCSVWTFRLILKIFEHHDTKICPSSEFAMEFLSIFSVKSSKFPETEPSPSFRVLCGWNPAITLTSPRVKILQLSTLSSIWNPYISYVLTFKGHGRDRVYSCTQYQQQNSSNIYTVCIYSNVHRLFFKCTSFILGYFEFFWYPKILAKYSWIPSNLWFRKNNKSQIDRKYKFLVT